MKKIKNVKIVDKSTVVAEMCALALIGAQEIEAPKRMQRILGIIADELGNCTDTALVKKNYEELREQTIHAKKHYTK